MKHLFLSTFMLASLFSVAAQAAIKIPALTCGAANSDHSGPIVLMGSVPTPEVRAPEMILSKNDSSIYVKKLDQSGAPYVREAIASIKKTDVGVYTIYVAMNRSVTLQVNYDKNSENGIYSAKMVHFKDGPIADYYCEKVKVVPKHPAVSGGSN